MVKIRKTPSSQHQSKDHTLPLMSWENHHTQVDISRAFLQEMPFSAELLDNLHVWKFWMARLWQNHYKWGYTNTWETLLVPLQIQRADLDITPVKASMKPPESSWDHEATLGWVLSRSTWKNKRHEHQQISRVLKGILLPCQEIGN